VALTVPGPGADPIREPEFIDRNLGRNTHRGGSKLDEELGRLDGLTNKS